MLNSRTEEDETVGQSIMEMRAVSGDALLLATFSSHQTAFVNRFSNAVRQKYVEMK